MALETDKRRLCRVDAAWKVQAVEHMKRSVIIIKFSKETVDREQKLQR
jgi:hypothetical protein